MGDARSLLRSKVKKRNRFLVGDRVRTLEKIGRVPCRTRGTVKAVGPSFLAIEFDQLRGPWFAGCVQSDVRVVPEKQGLWIRRKNLEKIAPKRVVVTGSIPGWPTAMEKGTLQDITDDDGAVIIFEHEIESTWGAKNRLLTVPLSLIREIEGDVLGYTEPLAAQITKTIREGKAILNPPPPIARVEGLKQSEEEDGNFRSYIQAADEEILESLGIPDKDKDFDPRVALGFDRPPQVEEKLLVPIVIPWADAAGEMEDKGWEIRRFEEGSRIKAVALVLGGAIRWSLMDLGEGTVSAHLMFYNPVGEGASASCPVDVLPTPEEAAHILGLEQKKEDRGR